jgi:hypothetical protein
MTTAPAVVQLTLTVGPFGNGLCSVSTTTVAALSPMFSTVKLQVTVWPIVVIAGAQTFVPDAPVGVWACAGFAPTSVPTAATSATVSPSARRQDRDAIVMYSPFCLGLFPARGVYRELMN